MGGGRTYHRGVTVETCQSVCREEPLKGRGLWGRFRTGDFEHIRIKKRETDRRIRSLSEECEEGGVVLK